MLHDMNLLIIGLLILCGLLAGRVSEHLGLPRIVGYIIAGLCFSPELLGRYPVFDSSQWTGTITSVALGIIAYLIGGSITTGHLRHLGKVIIGGALGGALGAMLIVFVVLLFILPVQASLPGLMTLALAYAAIATTTAPTNTLAVLHQYRATGPLSTTLLGVVALDDAIGIILFSLVIAMVSNGTLNGALIHSGIEIGGALLLGSVSGWLMALIGARASTIEYRLPLIIGSLLLLYSLSEFWSFSPLLANMTAGFVCRHRLKAGGETMFRPVEYFEELIFVVFFTLAGAHFEFHVFQDSFWLVLAYFLARLLGKILGSSAGAWLAHAPARVTRYLGLAMLPQAGVAVGLALTLSQTPGFERYGTVIVNVILASTLLNELSGPAAARYALARAGEIGQVKPARRDRQNNRRTSS